MARKVFAAVEDLLFRSKISATAESLNAEASFPRSPKKLLEGAAQESPDLLVLDLNSARFEPLKLLEELKAGDATRDVPVVGFLSHVQKDLAVAARERGCDRIMARSAFVKELPQILGGNRGEAGDGR
jgi:PleD family two-component response regulator